MYKSMKKLIELTKAGKLQHSKEELIAKCDIFLQTKRLNEEEYTELIALINEL